MALTLHYHPLSSFCWKALVALYENGTPFTPHLVNLGDPEARAAFVKLWPIGKFPVLRDEARGETVPESTVIIDYLDRHYPGATKFIAADPELAAQTRLRDRFLDLPVHLLERNHVRIVILFHAIERAEFAIDIADVGVIDIAIDDVGDDFVAAPVEILRLRQLAAAVGERAKLFERQLVKPQRLGGVDALSVPDFLEQAIQ